jgi:hypothetical protein
VSAIGGLQENNLPVIGREGVYGAKVADFKMGHEVLALFGANSLLRSYRMPVGSAHQQRVVDIRVRAREVRVQEGIENNRGVAISDVPVIYYT